MCSLQCNTSLCLWKFLNISLHKSWPPHLLVVSFSGPPAGLSLGVKEAYTSIHRLISPSLAPAFSKRQWNTALDSLTRLPYPGIEQPPPPVRSESFEHIISIQPAWSGSPSHIPDDIPFATIVHLSADRPLFLQQFSVQSFNQPSDRCCH
jgi:hypothetical protein